MNLPQLVERFGSEDKCRDYLEDLRWPDGVECPRCDSKKISRIADRKQYECSDCRYQFSVTAGTIMHDTRLPLWKWFLAIYLVTESEKGISAKQLQRTLGVSYKTAWYLCHRIRDAMGDDDDQPMLRGVVEADETYIGGKPRNRQHGPRSQQRAALMRQDNKTVVLGAIERGGELRLRVAPNSKEGPVQDFLKDVVHGDAEAIYTDSHRSYRGIHDGNTRHEYVDHSRDEWVRGDVHTNTIESAWSLFDRAIIGSYHKISKKHLPAYLDEFEWRFNNRDNPFLFRDTMLRIVNADALGYQNLIDP